MEAAQMFTAYDRRLVLKEVSKSALADYRVTARAFTAWVAEQGLELADVRGRHIEEFMASTGWAPSTKRARLTWLRRPWIYAVKELDALDRTPFDGLEIELPKIPKRQPRTISPAVLRQIKANLKTVDDWALFAAFAYTGMRSIEVCRLQWEGVSFADQTLTFVGKGDKERTIPMLPELAAALKELGPYRKGSAWVFPGRQRGQMAHSGIWKAVKRITAPHDVQPHDFRRTVATSLEDNEAREAAIKQILWGHASGDIRLHHYTAVSQKVLYREMCKLYRDSPV